MYEYFQVTMTIIISYHLSQNNENNFMSFYDFYRFFS